jgi:RNA polymerase sigma factor (TIGR02999 family)
MVSAGQRIDLRGRPDADGAASGRATAAHDHGDNALVTAPAEPPPAPPPGGGALFAAVYQQLHAIAQRLLEGERTGHTLQPTALLHEAWLRLQHNDAPPPDRESFVRAAAGSMRRILVEHARARGRHKRGGGKMRSEFDPDLVMVAEAEPETVLAVDDALARLEGVDPGLVRHVELRVFAGLSHPQIAQTLGVSLRTVERNWRLARAWLQQALGGGDGT